ncbi:hypothetical protein BOW53_13505 [Solemya pervernicosa gill symbiont]|uniref:Sulfate transporter CysZ n=2 Tax=Gammaproteobacteria incertae sedis TaxID=118884 RepID=A0A1T2L1J9_9GAMM|nr:sulfate transporter CysZ [Candidatus Reidiella endopervernicosa]OOZ38969.1 hypothetical protein BOW53_13505 [Solemya pervernicosa gill symbiont]QKQ26594.1 sulfate transporter CysZ [Candidatus Reidiella endopervernicosa]
MLADPFRGAGLFLQGIGLMFKPGVKRFVAIPLTINVVLFAIVIAVLAGQFDELINWMLPSLPSWLSWLESILWFIFALLAALMVFFGFSLLANLVAAPFNGLLAEAVERHLGGQEPPPASSITAAIKGAPGAIFDEIRKLIYALLWAIPLLIISIIPIFTPFAPFLWAIYGAWMLSLEYADFPMGNHNIRFKDQRQKLRRNRLLSLSFGGTTLLATMIPVLNFLVMPAAVCGATSMWVKRLSQQS